MAFLRELGTEEVDIVVAVPTPQLGRTYFTANGMDVNGELDESIREEMPEGGHEVKDAVEDGEDFNPEELRKARARPTSARLACTTRSCILVQERSEATQKDPVSTKSVVLVKDSDGQRFVGSGLVARDLQEKRLEWYEAKVRVLLECGARECREIVIRGCLLPWRDSHVEIEAHDKLAKAIRHEIGIIPGSNGLMVPAVREDGDASECADFLERGMRRVTEESRPEQTGRPVRHQGGGTARPTVQDLERVKKPARYLQAAPR